MSRIMSLLAVGVCLLNLATVASADAVALDYTTPGSTDVWPAAFGWEFTTGSNVISVTSLGVQDQTTGDGAWRNTTNHDSQVGIYKVSDQSLIVSTTVLATDSNQGTKWLWHALASAVDLDPNTTYMIATGLPAGEWYNVGPSGVTSGDSNVTINSSQGFYSATGGAMAFPTNSTFFDTAANFQYTATPEPMTMSLLAFGGLTLLRRR